MANDGVTEHKKAKPSLAEFAERARGGAASVLSSSDFVSNAGLAAPLNNRKVLDACAMFMPKALEFQKNLEDFSNAMQTADLSNLDPLTLGKIVEAAQIVVDTNKLSKATTDICGASVLLDKEMRRQLQQAPASEPPRAPGLSL